jgi:hypothetical protein
MIVWINGTHGVAKTTTSRLMQQLLPDVEPYYEAARTWLHDDAEVVDTTGITPAAAAQQIADSVLADAR